VTVCSTAFEALGRAQASALGCSSLPIAIVPHPFGLRARGELPRLAEDVAAQVAKLVSIQPEAAPLHNTSFSERAADRAKTIIAPDDIEALHHFFIERRLSDGLPVIPPTSARVARMLEHTQRSRYDLVGTVAPAFGAATVERIAINAVLAGCASATLDVLIAAVEAVMAPEFNLQGIQATTNPAAVWLVLNGPVAEQLGVNSGPNCLGQGASANATLGRALRLVLQNIGGAYPGEMDRATHGQPGKFSMCCAENEGASPWEPVHVERGFERGASTATVVGFAGTLNMNSHTKNADELVRAIADTMAYAPSNDYWIGGEPWIVLSPEHAAILAQAGLSKGEVKRRLWQQSRMGASRMTDTDYERTRRTRRAELGDISRDTLLPIATDAARIGIIVAGGPGTHSVYIPGFGNSRSVTRRIGGSGLNAPE
jgi:hypothetical protein